MSRTVSRIQDEIIRVLRSNSGAMETRDLKKEIRADRLGTELWDRAYLGLIQYKQIKYWDGATVLPFSDGTYPEDAWV